MKKWMRLISISLVVILLFSGCGGVSGAKKNKERTLTICVDPELSLIADTVVDMFKKIYKDVQVSVEIISGDAAAAEAKITKLRTQILAGEGPDVFLMSCPDYIYLEKEASLFDNPEQAIRSDVFLPLDEYIANATYMDVNKWNSQIMDAGKTDDGQMVIPITYSYYGFMQKTETLPDGENIPLSWSEFSQWDNSSVKRYTQEGMPMAFTYLFGNVCDYDTGTVLYSEDDIYNVLDSVNSYMNAGNFAEAHEEFVGCGEVDLSLLEYFHGNEALTYYALPNMEGGTSAIITSYTAINANTKNPDLAFAFLDVLCSDEFVGGLGFEFEGYDYTFAAGWTSSWMWYGMPVYEHGFVGSLKYISDQEVEMIRNVTENLDSVRFMSNVEWDLIQLFDMTFMNGWSETLDEETFREAIRKTIDSWELQLKE